VKMETRNRLLRGHVTCEKQIKISRAKPGRV
jgi:hypothetical protein